MTHEHVLGHSAQTIFGRNKVDVHQQLARATPMLLLLPLLQQYYQVYGLTGIAAQFLAGRAWQSADLVCVMGAAANAGILHVCELLPPLFIV